MNPVISNNASTRSNLVQPVRPVEPGGRNGRNVDGAAPASADAPTAPSAIVTINPAARERAQADRASASGAAGADTPAGSTGQAGANARANRPAGAAAAVNGNSSGTGNSSGSGNNRLPSNVSAALRAYESAQVNPATATDPTPRSQAVQANRSNAAANDPTGLDNEGRTRPTRAGDTDTAQAAEQAQASQQRDQAALLQGAAASATRLGNQSARVG